MVRATFEDFAEPSTSVEWGNHMMPITSLQEAFIRMFNKYIDQDVVERAMAHSGEVEPSLQEITLNEFRVVYQCMAAILAGNVPVESVETEFHGDMLGSYGAHFGTVESMPRRTTIHSAPALNLEGLSMLDEESPINSMRGVSEGSPRYAGANPAAGSAIHVVRNAKASAMNA